MSAQHQTATAIHVLIVEDDAHCAAQRGILSTQSGDRHLCDRWHDGRRLASRGRFDVIVLDLMLPGRGLEVCRVLRTRSDVPTLDPFTTNLCFGGRDMRTAYVTLSGTGRVHSMRWPRPGARRWKCAQSRLRWLSRRCGWAS